jgi:uncharacterized small protein (DUF1192 family)
MTDITPETVLRVAELHATIRVQAEEIKRLETEASTMRAWIANLELMLECGDTTKRKVKR